MGSQKLLLRWTWRAGIILLLLLCALPRPLPVDAQRPSEHQVKAAFLFNFPNFVEWPADVLTDTSTTLTIGILGKDPFGNVFLPFIEKTVKGRKARLERSDRLQELPFCHVLYICESEKKYLPQILEQFRGRSVLTVSASEGFAQAGVMINFVLEKSKVRFEINVDAAEGAGLKLSAKLLKLARIIEKEQS